MRLLSKCHTRIVHIEAGGSTACGFNHMICGTAALRFILVDIIRGPLPKPAWAFPKYHGVQPNHSRQQHRGSGVVGGGWVLIVDFPVQLPSRTLLVESSPLLKEKRYASLRALITN